MCNGEDQGEFERRMIPAFFILWNSCLATANLSNGNRRGRSDGTALRDDVMFNAVLVEGRLKPGY